MSWWIVAHMASPNAGEITFNYVNAATAPVKKGTVWGVWGPWDTKANAVKAYNDRSYTSKQVGTVSDSPKKPGQSILSSVTSGVLGPLFQANIWIRVAEVVLGIVLVAVGLAKLTNAVPVATKIAKVVA